MNWLKHSLLTATAAGIVFVVLPAWAGNTVLDKINTDPELATFAKAVKAAGLTESLSGPGPVTVFAPNNEAFDALPDGELSALMQPGAKDDLALLVKRHVVSGSVAVDPVSPVDRELTMMSGEALSLNVNEDYQALDTAHVLNSASAGNGTVYVVDEVIQSESDEGDED